MKIIIAEFKIEYRAWADQASYSQKKAIPGTYKVMMDLIENNPREAAKMLTLYRLECGPVGL